MGIKNYVIGFALTSLFVIAFITFAINLQTDNNVYSLLNDPLLTNLKDNATNQLASYEIDINQSESALSTTTPTVTTDSTQLVSVSGIRKNLYSRTYAVFIDTANFIFIKIFGGSKSFAIITTTLIVLIVSIGIIYAVKWVRTGEE